MIPGVPPLGGGGVGGWGWGVVRGCTPPTCTHTHACMHVHAHACVYDIISNPRDFTKSNGGSHLHEITMFTLHACACVCARACMCMHAHACVHVHACARVWRAPPNHPHPHPSTCHQHPPTPHPQELQEAENTKIR